MDKQLQNIIMLVFFLFLLSNILITLIIVQAIPVSDQSLMGLFLLLIGASIIFFVYSIVKTILDKDYTPFKNRDDLTDTSLFMFLVLNIYAIFFSKNFYMTNTTVSLDSILTVFYLLNYVFIIIVGFLLFNDFTHYFETNRHVCLVNTKRYFAIIAYFSPMIVMMTFIFSYANLPLTIPFNTYTLLAFAGIMISFVIYLRLTETTMTILVFKNSKKEELKELIDKIYASTESLEEYLNPKMKLATLFNMMTAIIVIPIYFYTLFVI